MTLTKDEPDIVQLPDAADAGIEITADDAESNFQEQARGVASKMKKCAVALVTSAALLAVGVGLDVGLGVGLSTKNGNKSVSRPTMPSRWRTVSKRRRRSKKGHSYLPGCQRLL